MDWCAGGGRAEGYDVRWCLSGCDSWNDFLEELKCSRIGLFDGCWLVSMKIDAMYLEVILGAESTVS